MSKRSRRAAAKAKSAIPPTVDPSLMIDVMRREIDALALECEGWYACAELKEDGIKKSKTEEAWWNWDFSPKNRKGAGGP